MNIIAIIPARYQSTRFPGKPLVMIQGKSMIRRVVEQTQKAKGIAKVVVATDDPRIFDHVKSFGGNVILSRENHLNGTSRCLEALEILDSSSDSPIEAVINVQGDEPGIQPEQIEQIVTLLNQPMVEIATLIKKIESEETLFNPNVVKVIFGEDHHALYFSRQAIPFLRGVEKKQWINNHSFYKHIGMYGYKSGILKQIMKLSPGKLEQAESLEQLRWLENGLSIHTQITEYESVGIDTPEDLQKLTNIF
ncbi:MAG: 3-deoxy-manno-octulosonate cytidylyltransferase [Bacteroidales bacterium]|nr:3-deoxy-manno-octulosonate cytidylyltransferase [Bacteroidales bacterium]